METQSYPRRHGTEVTRYEYDGLNRRIVEQVGTLASPAAATAAIRDVYYSQEWQALEERVRTSPSQVAATADTRFIWSPVYVDAMVERDRNADSSASTGASGLEERVYALQDANWNATGIVAASGVPGVPAGTVINRFVYTPYGESQTLAASWAAPAAGSTPATPWNHLFQGLKLTDVTGLVYVRHRDYSPTLGRFIERDPIGFEAGDHNWYRFVGNGPTGKTDPSGLHAINTLGPRLCRSKQQRPPTEYTPKKNGCTGVPQGFTFGSTYVSFREACNSHDVCYGTCGTDRLGCDVSFLTALKTACDNANLGWYWTQSCKSYAQSYYTGVYWAGAAYYEDAQNDACVWEPCCNAF